MVGIVFYFVLVFFDLFVFGVEKMIELCDYLFFVTSLGYSTVSACFAVIV